MPGLPLVVALVLLNLSNYLTHGTMAQTNASGKPTITADEAGSIHINTPESGATVYFNGVDVVELKDMLAALVNGTCEPGQQPPQALPDLSMTAFSSGIDAAIALTPGTNAPVMTYWVKDTLMLRVCSDALCGMVAVVKAIDTAGRVGNALALTPETHAPVIAYYDANNGDLKLCICSDALCATSTIKTLDTNGNVGTYASIALVPGTNAPVISYYDMSNNNLKICICSDAECTTATTKVLDSSTRTGTFTSLALTPGTGAPVVSYFNDLSTNLMICICTDAACDDTIIVTLDSDGWVGEYSSLALIPGTNAPVVTYYDSSNRNLKLCRCLDAECSDTAIEVLDSDGDVGLYTSLALTSGSNAPIISYYDTTNDDLKVCICSNAGCDNPTIKALDSNGNVGSHTALALAPETNAPVVLYFDSDEKDLKIAVCGTSTCGE